MVTFSDAPLQLLPLTKDAVMVAWPVPEKLAVFPEKVTMLLLDVQVVDAVTSCPFRLAENTALPLTMKLAGSGFEVIVRP